MALAWVCVSSFFDNENVIMTVVGERWLRAGMLKTEKGFELGDIIRTGSLCPGRSCHDTSGDWVYLSSPLHCHITKKRAIRGRLVIKLYVCGKLKYREQGDLHVHVHIYSVTPTLVSRTWIYTPKSLTSCNIPLLDFFLHVAIRHPCGRYALSASSAPPSLRVPFLQLHAYFFR